MNFLKPPRFVKSLLILIILLGISVVIMAFIVFIIGVENLDF